MKTKKLFLCIVLVVAALTLFEYANAELGFRSNSKVSLPDSTPADVDSKPSIPINQSAKKNSINSTQNGIQLHFRDYPLGEILKNIHEETGIRFNLSPTLAKKTISVDIEAKNWKNSVRKLVEDYSRVEVWTNQPKTSQIWLVESNSYN
jgi:type II secretory pathway component GspD/PulD (secretin)